MTLPQNIAAYTENTVAPQYVSINRAGRGVEITVRARPKDGQVYGPDATAVLSEKEFGALARQIIGDDDQVKRMTERFLGWRLPEHFCPDCGISFKAEFNEHTPHPGRHEPTGTNLFDYTQAEAMVRYMIEVEP